MSVIKKYINTKNNNNNDDNKESTAQSQRRCMIFTALTKGQPGRTETLSTTQQNNGKQNKTY